MKIRFMGKLNKVYDGHDQEDGKRVHSRTPGQVLEVSAAKALQLLKDYPQDFETVVESTTFADPALERASLEAKAKAKPHAKPKAKKA